MKFRLSEPVTLTLVVGTNRYRPYALRRAYDDVRSGSSRKPRAYRLIATDAAGNVSSVRYRAK